MSASAPEPPLHPWLNRLLSEGLESFNGWGLSDISKGYFERREYRFPGSHIVLGYKWLDVSPFQLVSADRRKSYHDERGSL